MNNDNIRQWKGKNADGQKLRAILNYDELSNAADILGDDEARGWALLLDDRLNKRMNLEGWADIYNADDADDLQKKHDFYNAKKWAKIPLDLYEHGLFAFQVAGSNADRWDTSRRVGYIYIDENNRVFDVLKYINDVINGGVYCLSIYIVKTCKCCGSVQLEAIDSRGGLVSDEDVQHILNESGEDWEYD